MTRLSPGVSWLSMLLFRVVSVVLSLWFLGVSARAEPPVPGTWKEWVTKASTEDLRAMIRYLEDARATVPDEGVFLTHHNRDVRGFALLWLARTLPGTPQSVIDSLADVDSQVRRTAAFALGQIGTPAGEEPLLSRLTVEENPLVIRELWKALGRVGGLRTIERISGLQSLHADSVRSGGLILARQRAQTDAQDFVLAALDSSDPSVVAAGYYALSRSRKKVPDTMLMRAVRALESIHDERVRRATIKLLSKRAGKASGQLTRLLKSRSFSGHERAALSLGISHVESSLTERRLISLLRHEIRQIRSRNTWLTENIHPAMVIASSLANRNLKATSRTKVSEILGWLPKTPQEPALKRRFAALRCELSGALRRLSPHCKEARAVNIRWRLHQNIDAVKAALTSAKSDVRVAAWSLLSDVKPELFRELLSEGLKDKDRVVSATVVSRAIEVKAPLQGHEAALTSLWNRAWKSGDIEVLLTLLKGVKTLSSTQSQVLINQAARSDWPALRRASLAESDAVNSIHSDSVKVLRIVPAKASYAPFRSDGSVARWRTLMVETEIGSFHVTLLRAFAPLTVSKIGSLFQKGFYQGLSFHRLVPNFVVQGGDPRGDGWGGPGTTMRCENNPIDYEEGTVGMALAGKDTGGSQFFIALDAQPHLLGTYTAFGRVSRGMEVVRALTRGDRILSTRLIR